MKALVGHTHVTPDIHGAGMVTCQNGKKYNLLDFRETDVDEDFIIESLAKFPRFIGHTLTSVPYSVGQHSCIMAESALLATGDLQLAWDCFWHDAVEAYMGDLMRPLKNLLPEYKAIEDRIEQVIFKKLGVRFPLDIDAKRIDLNICEYEISFLMNPTNPKQVFKIWTVEETIENMHSMLLRLERLKSIKEELKLIGKQ